jgi:hypothetical protein
MSTVSNVSCSGLTQTLIFSGVGQIIIRPLTAGSYWLGGPSVDDTTGVAIQNNDNLCLYITSPEDIYLYNENASSGTVRVYHNR